jgi:hypothetical protein
MCRGSPHLQGIPKMGIVSPVGGVGLCPVELMSDFLVLRSL